METKINSKQKEFDAVKTFRKIKESISKDTWGLSYEEFMKYLKMSSKPTLA
jgi:hypothetical protein